MKPYHEKLSSKAWSIKQSQIPQNFCTLTQLFLPKYIMFKLRKYRGVIFHDTKE